MKGIKHKIKNILLFFDLLKKRSKYYKVPFFKRVNMKLKGFTPDQYYQYDFKNNNYRNYLTEIERWKSRYINGKYNIILDDKLVFYHIFKMHLNVPKVIGWIKNEKIFDIFGNEVLIKEFSDIIKKEKKVIMKPKYSTGGKGVFTVEFLNDSSFIMENNVYDIKTFYNKIISYDNYIISKYISQHNYSNEVYDKTINTIRIVTILNDDGNVEIPIAIHRFGTKNSIPVDNCSNGGIFSKINLNTGELTSAKSYRTSDIYIKHPDNNNKICGVVVHNWDYIKEKVKKVACMFPQIPLLAWDIVPTEDDFYVLELNASTALTLIQMFEPQRNTSLGNFYRKKGIIK